MSELRQRVGTSRGSRTAGSADLPEPGTARTLQQLAEAADNASSGRTLFGA